MKNKEIELQKYLEKKRKQKTRDELLKQISDLSKGRDNLGSKLLKRKIKQKKKSTDKAFEATLFDDKENEDIKVDIISNSDSNYDANSNAKCDFNSTENTQINRASLGDINNLIASDYHSVPFINYEIKTEEEIQAQLAVSDESMQIKKSILELKENFETPPSLNRLESIQDQRKRLEIFYEEVEIVSRIKYSLITFIQGETGSGKTTQIPQFLYESGFSKFGKILLTQPRRFSAISISNRINFEANENISGYKIKYENTVKANTAVKVVTEGVLFREIQLDFLLSEYSVVILDEVHERSTTVDVLIGLLSKIIKIRLEMKKPLRLVLMSATVNPEHFKSVLGCFSLITLTSKPFPVSVFFESKTSNDYLDLALKKIREIIATEQKQHHSAKNKACEMQKQVINDKNAAILVFLTSKEDIYTLKAQIEALNKQLAVLPLHSGMSKAEQARVFLEYKTRKIILATNIAETSITIDDIVFVIDCGREKRRISDQNTVMYKTLFISKGSAKQRAGRAGRTCPGVCYRLYDGDTFETFSEYRHPEILVEPFDSIFLQLKSMGIKNIFNFPFIDLPAEDSITDSIHSLESIGALNITGDITKCGRKLCKFPVAPRYSKLLLDNINEQPALFARFAAIVSILSVGFEVKRNEHTRQYFLGSKSDLIVYLKIVIAYQQTENKKGFAVSSGISIDKFEEIRKMTAYLLRISNVPELSWQSCNISGEEEDKICKALYYLFADQLAINIGSFYMYKDGDLFISNDSIDPEKHNIVFDHIACAFKKQYAKNITVVSPSWFKVKPS
ncbi:hypothetical protein GINT2_000164 [Glugoides intestinalis]